MKHVSQFTVNEYGANADYRAEITEQVDGKCIVKIFRVRERDYERTAPGGVERKTLKSAKQFVREHFPKAHDLRLKWTLEASEKEPYCK